MKTIYVLPEMVAAGTEALVECRTAKMDEDETAVAVFLAMRAVELIATLPSDNTVH